MQIQKASKINSFFENSFIIKPRTHTHTRAHTHTHTHAHTHAHTHTHTHTRAHTHARTHIWHWSANGTGAVWHDSCYIV